MFESPDFIQLGFFFAVLDEKRCWDRESRYTIRIAGTHFECCCPHK
jgi:hypothetical protein